MIVEERRWKLFPVSESLVVELLTAYRRASKTWYFYVADYPELPADAVVRDIRHDPYNRCYQLLVYHPSFPVVPDGATVPDAYDRGTLNHVLKRVRVEDADTPDTPAVRGDA